MWTCSHLLGRPRQRSGERMSLAPSSLSCVLRGELPPIQSGRWRDCRVLWTGLSAVIYSCYRSKRVSTEELHRQEKKAWGEEGAERGVYTHKNLGRIGNLNAAMSNIRFQVPHKAQMGELRECLFCNHLDEIWCDICDCDCEVLNSACG